MQEKKTAFVIMPFSSTTTCTEDEWTEIYDNIFKSAIEDCGYACERAMPVTGSLIRSILEKLKYSWIVLADITDRNPNVFYELGVRHSLSKRTIIIAQDSSHLPSDLRGYWFINYGTSPGKVTRFKNQIRRLLEEIELNPDRSDNPVSDFLDQENLNISNYVQRENIKKLTALYTECTGNIIQLSILSTDSNADNYISHDCLKLLLQTLYVDIGPDLLKAAYELHYKLRSVEMGRREKELLKSTLDDLKSLSEKIYAIKNKLLRGEYTEPNTISTMIWKLGASNLHLPGLPDFGTSIGSVGYFGDPKPDCASELLHILDKLTNESGKKEE